VYVGCLLTCVDRLALSEYYDAVVNIVTKGLDDITTAPLRLLKFFQKYTTAPHSFDMAITL
jgi:hypothetical protein